MKPMDTFLTPIEKPTGLMMKLVFAMTRRKVGKVLTPLKVFSARLPLRFGQFYAKVSQLGDCQGHGREPPGSLAAPQSAQDGGTCRGPRAASKHCEGGSTDSGVRLSSHSSRRPSGRQQEKGNHDERADGVQGDRSEQRAKDRER